MMEGSVDPEAVRRLKTLETIGLRLDILRDKLLVMEVATGRNINAVMGLAGADCGNCGSKFN
ncbi:MAG: hypothetical protein ACLQGU_04295 [bacterium]